MLSLQPEADGLLAGTFDTALEDSIFFGTPLRIAGVHSGAGLAFSFGLERDGVATVCSFTGRLDEGRIETVWHVVTAGKPWPHAIMTNADRFERLD
ncbi:MAG: hypothetical protein JF628_14340 [Sphingomonas sp.]|nr:hypothetical protein [Sphingomonas sp.]